jgi:hypothetical protein
MILNESGGIGKVKPKSKTKKKPSISGKKQYKTRGDSAKAGAKKKKGSAKTKLPMFQNHKATDSKKKKGHLLKPIKDALTPPSKKDVEKRRKAIGKAVTDTRTGKTTTKSHKSTSKPKKNKSMINTHEDQTSNKSVRDSWNKANGVGTKKVTPVVKKPVVANTVKKKPVVTTKAPITKTPVKTKTTKAPVTKTPVTKAPVTKTTPKKTTTPPKKTTTKTPVAPKPTDWSKYTSAQLDKDAKLRGDYIKANPNSTYTKNWQTKDYNRYNDMILNNKGMTDGQRKYYNQMIGKWGWDDYNDVNVQNQYHLKQDKTKELDAQTVTLNKSLGTMDAQAFQDKQAMQQEISNRGITDSGIAADAYTRAQALNGQNYSAAYAQSAQDKADISAKYTDLLNQSKQTQAESKSAQEAATAESVTAQLKAQTEQDKYLTSSTGYVYLNGKVLKDKNGKPLTSLAYQKMLEDSRHNQANESANMQKINNDLALATQKLQLNYATLDLKSQQAQADIANAQAKLELASRNADTAEVRVQAGILNTEIKSIQKQIDGYRKSGKKVPKSLKSKLKSVMGKMDKLANMGK